MSAARTLQALSLMTAALLVGCGGNTTTGVSGSGGGGGTGTAGSGPTLSVDPDLGKSLAPLALTLTAQQMTATISALQLSFSSGRTLRAVNLPAGVTGSLNATSHTLTLTLNPAQASAGTTAAELQYLGADGRVLLSAPLTLTVTLSAAAPPSATPTPSTPAPSTPADPDAGLTLAGGALALNAAQPSVTVTAPELSFSSGRTLSFLNLPAGVTQRLDTSTKSVTLSLNPALASAGSHPLTLQYQEASGRVLLSSTYTLSVTLPQAADPDAGQTLNVPSLKLSSSQPSAVINASNLSFSAGRTLKFSSLPAGVTASVNATTRSATLTLDPLRASSGNSSIGVQYVTASGSMLLSTQVQLTVTLASAASGGYHFTLVFAPGTDARVKTAAQAAAARWEQIVTKSIGAQNVVLAAQDCGNTAAFNANVQDMVIFVGSEAMDGAGGTLARSGPCLVTGQNMPVAAQLVFDTADVDALAPQLPSIALHEFGHALGIGSLWRLQGLLQGYGTTDPRYTGSQGKREYAALGGTLGSVPVENSGGSGTAYGHWREKTFGNELMTGYLNSGSNPLSRLSIAALADLGYSVNYAPADAYAASTLNSLSSELHVEDGFQRPDIKVLH